MQNQKFLTRLKYLILQHGVFPEVPATMSEARRSIYTIVTMHDGRVLIAGGRNFDNPNAPGAKVHDSAEIFDPKTNTFTPTGSMNVPRNMFMAILLDDGRVLIAGGGDSSGGAGSMAYRHCRDL